MDRILPIDLEHPKLRKSFRGYETTTVDALLAAAAETLERLMAENEELRDMSARQQAELESFRIQETTLKDALILAQKAADDTRAAAQKQADLILEEARQAALAERMSIQQRLSELRWELDQLKAEKRRFGEDFRHLLDRHRADLEKILDQGLSVVSSEATPA